MALSDLITDCRILADDAVDSNLVVQETLGGVVDGSNKNFRLQNIKIVGGSVYISTAGGAFRSTTGFTVDLVNGIIAYTAAPAAAAVLTADYNFYWFTDTDWTQFLNNAALMIGTNPDPTTVVPGLIQALEQFALYYFFMRRATTYANKYQSAGGQASQNVDSVTKNFQMLASTALKSGNQIRDDFYKGQGSQNKVAVSIQTYKFDPMTPPR